MSGYITGRVNVHQIVEEDPIESCEADLILFAHHFGEYPFIITREDKKKCGLPTHLHYHFIFTIPESEDVTKVRASMRRWLTETGYEKHLSSVKVTDNKEKALFYVLKQQDVFLYNLPDDELEQLMKSSAMYNESLQINNWTDHLEEIIRQLENHFKTFVSPKYYITDETLDVSAKYNKVLEPTGYNRIEALRFIHEYIVKWNKQQNKALWISFVNLHPSKILTMFHFIESKLLSIDHAFNYLELDNFNHLK